LLAFVVGGLVLSLYCRSECWNRSYIISCDSG